jgi:hypothetical protein
VVAKRLLRDVERVQPAALDFLREVLHHALIAEDESTRRPPTARRCTAERNSRPPE